MKTGDNASPCIGGTPKDTQCIELMLRIQVIGRLVEQIDVWSLGQHLGDRDSAPLATGQGENVTGGQSSEPHAAQSIIRDRVIVRGLPAKSADVRVPSNQHRVDDSCGKDIVNNLWQ